MGILIEVEELRKKHLCLLNCVCLYWKQVIRKVQASCITRSQSGAFFIFYLKRSFYKPEKNYSVSGMGGMRRGRRNSAKKKRWKEKQCFNQSKIVTKSTAFIEIRDKAEICAFFKKKNKNTILGAAQALPLLLCQKGEKKKKRKYDFGRLLCSISLLFFQDVLISSVFLLLSFWCKGLLSVGCFVLFFHKKLFFMPFYFLFFNSCALRCAKNFVQANQDQVYS